MNMTKHYFIVDYKNNLFFFLKSIHDMKRRVEFVNTTQVILNENILNNRQHICIYLCIIFCSFVKGMRFV